MIKKKIKKRRAKTNVETVRRVFSGIDQGDKFWKAKVGKNIIRILPSNREDGNVAFHSMLHYGFKLDGKNRAFPCMSAFKKSCPVCKVIAYYDNESDPDIKEAIKNLGVRHQFLMNIIDRSGDPKVKIYSAPKSVMSELMHFFNDDDYGDITDEEEGRDIKIDRVGEMFQTKYSTRVSPKVSAIDVEDWESQLFNLEKEAYIEIPSTKKYEEYLEECYGNVLNIQVALGYEESEEDDEDEAPRKKTKVKTKVKTKIGKRNPKTAGDDKENVYDDEDDLGDDADSLFDED